MSKDIRRNMILPFLINTWTAKGTNLKVLRKLMMKQLKGDKWTFHPFEKEGIVSSFSIDNKSFLKTVNS